MPHQIYDLNPQSFGCIKSSAKVPGQCSAPRSSCMLSISCAAKPQPQVPTQPPHATSSTFPRRICWPSIFNLCSRRARLCVTESVLSPTVQRVHLLLWWSPFPWMSIIKHTCTIIKSCFTVTQNRMWLQLNVHECDRASSRCPQHEATGLRVFGAKTREYWNIRRRWEFSGLALWHASALRRKILRGFDHIILACNYFGFAPSYQYVLARLFLGGISSLVLVIVIVKVVIYHEHHAPFLSSPKHVAFQATSTLSAYLPASAKGTDTKQPV